MSSRIVDLRRPKASPKRDSTREAPRERKASGPVRLRTRRRRTRIVIATCIILLLAGVVYGIHRASYATALTIQSISVDGARTVPAEAIESDARLILNDDSHHFFARDDIFIYPKKVLEHALVADFPRLDTVVVSRAGVFSNDLQVTVTERTPEARWCSGDAPPACYLMDEHGFVFTEASDTEIPKVPYVFSGQITGEPIGQTYAPGHLQSLVALLDQLGNAGYAPEGAAVVSDQDLSISFGRGYYIKVSFGEDASAILHNLQLVLTSDALRGKEDELEYVDLRFGNRVYYKLKGKDETQSQ